MFPPVGDILVADADQGREEDSLELRLQEISAEHVGRSQY